MCSIRGGGVVLATRHETRDEGDRLRVRDRDLAIGIDRDTTPFEHAEIAGKNQGALLRRRRERAVIAESMKLDAADELIEHGAAPHLRAGQFCTRPETQVRKR